MHGDECFHKWTIKWLLSAQLILWTCLQLLFVSDAFFLTIFADGPHQSYSYCIHCNAYLQSEMACQKRHQPKLSYPHMLLKSFECRTAGKFRTLGQTLQYWYTTSLQPSQMFVLSRHPFMMLIPSRDCNVRLTGGTTDWLAFLMLCDVRVLMDCCQLGRCGLIHQTTSFE